MFFEVICVRICVAHNSFVLACPCLLPTDEVKQKAVDNKGRDSLWLSLSFWGTWTLGFPRQNRWQVFRSFKLHSEWQLIIEYQRITTLQMNNVIEIVSMRICLNHGTTSGTLKHIHRGSLLKVKAKGT